MPNTTSGEMSAGIDSTGTMIAESSVNGETVYTQSLQPDRNHSFNNLFANRKSPASMPLSTNIYLST